jgi:glycosyltransferase involved in cell wall biosynthesis
MTNRRAIVSVTNDLTTDQRVDRTCLTLGEQGFEVWLIGRHRPGSMPLSARSYRTIRMTLLFDKGPLFYAEYNIRLFLFLLASRTGLIFTNDLDTLPAGYLASILKRSRHIHDCHEYFRGVPELVGRKRTLAIWKWIEDRIFPRLKTVTAVNRSVADLYSAEYGIPIAVMRNVPLRKPGSAVVNRTEAGIPEGAQVILYQGAVNVDRGLEEAILAMEHVKTNAVLLILGTGDIIGNLHELVRTRNLGTKVILKGAIPLDRLHGYTLLGDIGLSIEKDVCINYFNALPNKFMDYIQAGVPVLISPFPEMKAIVDRFGIGECIDSHDPARLARHFDSLLGNHEKLDLYRKNMIPAAEELCWENEKTVLQKLLI